MHLLTLSMPTTFRANDRFVEKIREVIRVLIGTENDVTAASTIAPIWPSFGDKFFAAKAYAPTTAIPGLGKNSDPINEHASLYCAFAPSARCQISSAPAAPPFRGSDP